MSGRKTVKIGVVMVESEKIGRLLRVASALCILALPACSTILTGLVGKSQEEQNAAKPVAATQAPPATAFVSDSALMPNFAGQTILPPTLPMDSDSDACDTPTPAASSGPHRTIAVAPLSSDPSKLAMLGAAANRGSASPDAHFILLVLAPPAADAATMDRTNAASRLAAGAALKALGDAGIAADRVDVSLATNPGVGDGEMRLYLR